MQKEQDACCHRNRGAAAQTCDKAVSWRRALSVPNPAASPEGIALLPPYTHTHTHQGQQIPQASADLLRTLGFCQALTELTLVKEMAKDAVRGCVEKIDPLVLWHITSHRRTLPDRILEWPHFGSDVTSTHAYSLQGWDAILQDALYALKHYMHYLVLCTPKL